MREYKFDQCIVTLTRKCNLRCGFCFAQDVGYDDNDKIDYENLKKIVDLCVDARVKYILLSGGEPTLYPKVFDILQYIKSRTNKIQVAIATNGIKLQDESFCKELIDSGIDYIDISVKGKDADECIQTVGCDCTSQQKMAIANLSRQNIEFTCSMVITHDNVNTFCEAVEMAKKSGGKQFSFTLVIDNLQANEKGIAYLVKHNPFNLIQGFISQIKRLNQITDGEWWLEYTFPICTFTKSQLEVLKGRIASPCHVFDKSCIVFDTQMNLLPCDMYLDSYMGKFGIDFSSYDELLKVTNSSLYKYITDSVKKIPSEECLKCNDFDICRGGCPVFWKNFSYDDLRQFRLLQK